MPTHRLQQHPRSDGKAPTQNSGDMGLNIVCSRGLSGEKRSDSGVSWRKKRVTLDGLVPHLSSFAATSPKDVGKTMSAALLSSKSWTASLRSPYHVSRLFSLLLSPSCKAPSHE